MLGMNKEDWIYVITRAIFVTILMMLPFFILIYIRFFYNLETLSVWVYGVGCLGWMYIILILNQMQMQGIFRNNNQEGDEK